MYHTVFDTANVREEEDCGRTFYFGLRPGYSFLSVEASLDQVCWKMNSLVAFAFTLNLFDLCYLPQGHFSLPGAKEVPYGLGGRDFL